MNKNGASIFGHYSLYWVAWTRLIYGKVVSLTATFICYVSLILREDLSFPKQKQKRSGLGDTNGNRGKGMDREERREGKLWAECKINKQI